jgi:hypothetical protein
VRSWLCAVVVGAACGARANRVVRDVADAGGGYDAAPPADAGCSTEDADGDGWSPCTGDCDDLEAAVHPDVPDPGTGWSQRRVAAAPWASSPSVVVGDDGVVHVAWHERTGETTAEIRYADDRRGAFEVETIAPATGLFRVNVGIGLAADGSPQVGWDDEMLTQAWIEDGAWQTEALPFCGMRSAFAIAPDGRLHFVYAPVCEGRVAVDQAWRDPEELEWHVETLPATVEGAAEELFDVLSLVATEGGNLQFARLSAGRGAVLYTEELGGVASEETAADVDANAISLALGPDGEPRIAWEGGAVGFSTRESGAWTTETLTPVIRLDRAEPAYVVLGLDAEGLPRIAYWDEAARLLTWGPAGWTDEPMAIDGRPRRMTDDGTVLYQGWTFLSVAAPLDGDGTDHNCDGVLGVDADGDGHASFATGGDDCDDARSDVYSAAPELVGDGVDQDCRDGVD